MSMRLILQAVLALLVIAQAGFPAEEKTPPAKAKSALDKPTMEAYVRHLFVWGPTIQVSITDPKPSALPGFQEIHAIGSAGKARQDEMFYVSNDGKKIVRGSVFDVAENPFKPDLDLLKTDLQPSFGTPGAPVVLVLFSDFQCPFCKDEAKMLRENILSNYPKEVRVYFKDLPLEPIHPWAKPAALAGRCIFRQNGDAFWKYHDWVYENQKEITAENFREKLLAFAKDKEVDVVALGSCLDKRETEAEITKSLQDAQALRVMSTPTLFVNGRRIPSQISWPQLKQVIDFEIEYQKTAKNAGEDCGCEIKLPSPIPQ